jgi:hypothetical protein
VFFADSATGVIDCEDGDVLHGSIHNSSIQ